jgi:hypothetical protein
LVDLDGDDNDANYVYFGLNNQPDEVTLLVTNGRQRQIFTHQFTLRLVEIEAKA